jgi:dTDP-4-dehydrorhamnose reductase
VLKKNKIVVTGGSGRFGSILKKIKTNNKIYFPTKKELDILKIISITKM